MSSERKDHCSRFEAADFRRSGPDRNVRQEKRRGTEKDALRAGLAEAIRFGRGMDRLLNDAMQLATDVLTKIEGQNQIVELTFQSF